MSNMNMWIPFVIFSVCFQYYKIKILQLLLGILGYREPLK